MHLFSVCYSPSHAFPLKIRCRCLLHRTSLYLLFAIVFSILPLRFGMPMNMKLWSILMRQLKLYFRKLHLEIIGGILSALRLIKKKCLGFSLCYWGEGCTSVLYTLINFIESWSSGNNSHTKQFQSRVKFHAQLHFSVAFLSLHKLLERSK